MPAKARQPQPLQGSTQAPILRIPRSRRLEAAQRLVEASNAGRGAGQRFLDAAAAHGVDLTHLWASTSEDGGHIRHVCLLVPGAGHIAMLFTSLPATKDEQIELGAVITHACEGASDIRLVQALLEPHEKASLAAFLQGGFQQLGDLLYMTRTWRELSTAPPHPPWPDDVTVTPWRPDQDKALAHALERSYEDTLDCPELCGLRDTRDVVASHRATGKFDPKLWWIIHHHDKPAGALLLNPCPEQTHVELVYLGLAPSLRGRGLACSLLHMGIERLRGERLRTVTCAVDERNAPARRLYERFGFQAGARRIALIRALDEQPVDKR